MIVLEEAKQQYGRPITLENITETLIECAAFFNHVMNKIGYLKQVYAGAQPQLESLQHGGQRHRSVWRTPWRPNGCTAGKGGHR